MAAGELLERGCASLGLDLGATQLANLLAYLELLQRWNSAFNLTSVRDESQMVIRHLLDSLSILPHLRGDSLIDVGSGAGLPGIPLAIADPARSYTLLDSNGKKTRFMFQAISALGLANCQVVKARVETWQPEAPFDAVLSRAFASLDDMTDTCRHLIDGQGCFLAMKGAIPEEELAGIENRAEVLAVTKIAVPGLDEARCLITLRPVS